MSRVADGGGGPASPVEVEFESIQAAVSKMKAISDRIATLEKSFTSFAGGVSASDWSNEPSCTAFGASYKDAVGAYAAVISGMKADLLAYSKALDAAYQQYVQSDDNSAAALKKLGAVDDKGLAEDSRGHKEYGDHTKTLSSDERTKPTDTTPHDSRSTTMPTGTNGAGNGGNGGSQAATTPGTSTLKPPGSAHANAR